jgi:hypothetical protein
MGDGNRLGVIRNDTRGMLMHTAYLRRVRFVRFMYLGHTNLRLSD